MDLLFENLDTAKKNVVWLLNNPKGLVDMHGLKYWVGEVERLYEEITASLPY